MHGTLLAAVSPVNTPHGYNLTFAFPMLLFIVIAGALYLRFRTPHKVPGHAAMAAASGLAETAAAGADTVGAGAAEVADGQDDGTGE